MVKEPEGGIKIPIKDMKDGILKDSRGTMVVQDPFQLDFCITKEYNTQTWRNHCKYFLKYGFCNKSFWKDEPLTS